MSFEERYEESSELTSLAHEIAAASKHLSESSTFNWGLVFTSIEQEHYGGKCRRLDEAMRFKTELDYLIVIYKEHFEKMKPDEKVALIVHELHHIVSSSRGNPQLRKHGGDYCEIPSHDKFSQDIAASIIGKLPTITKMPFQTTMEELEK